MQVCILDRQLMALTRVHNLQKYGEVQASTCRCTVCCRSPVVDMAVGGGRLLALHDATFMSAGAAGQRNVLQLWDPVAEVSVAAAHDFMESYELVCFAVTEPEAGASEVIAGAVHGGEPLL